MVFNQLDKVFLNLKRRKKKALIAYLAAGYPRLSEERRLIQTMQEVGVDILEVGVPFSDPIADGPTIQFASQKALSQGITLRKILRWIAGFKPDIEIPVVIMSYLNPILSFGLKAFAQQAHRAGVVGVIVPDLIPEESNEIRRALEEKKIHLIHLVAPTTPRERQKSIAKKTGGFLYAVSVAGVTGARRALPKETKAWLTGLRRMSSTPVCVGFGISGPEQIRALRGSVDGFIVGSALIDVIRKNKPARRTGKMRSFVKKLAKECSGGR